MKDLRKKV